MLAASDTEIGPILTEFSSRGIEVAFLVPTETGIEKSIMDATDSVRRYLLDTGIHCYRSQLQGPENKRRVVAHFVGATRTYATHASLYRPVTKAGDPRIWFDGLKKYASARNLLVLAVLDGSIFVINASRPEIIGTIGDPKSPLGSLIQALGSKSRAAADELIDRLREIAEAGWLPSVTLGDTGVGMTLEHALGITPNTNKHGDFKGIEIKAARASRGGRTVRNRDNLFSQVPDWDISRLKSGLEIVNQYGYSDPSTSRRQLYCTVGPTPNPQGLYLSVDEDSGRLDNRHRIGESTSAVVSWQISHLRARLLEKHSESMWVKARSKPINDREHFLYFEALYTRAPIASNLEILLESGDVTMDYTLSVNERGKARDHGYLFKIRPTSFGLLFPTQERIALV